MHKIGLKLFSTNTNCYYAEAKKIYDQGFFDYIELYVVPNTLHTIKEWKKLNIPFILHNAHFRHGFNLAKKEQTSENKKIYMETKTFADELNVDTIIFHLGIDGNINESARQLIALNEKRAIVENKPCIALPNKVNAKLCRGATMEEIAFVMHEAECGLCLDFGHAICAANYLKQDRMEFISKLATLKPKMYHLTDVDDIESSYDSHINIGKGQLDFLQILDTIHTDSMLTLETNKNFPTSLRDFCEDSQNFRNFEKMMCR